MGRCFGNWVGWAVLIPPLFATGASSSGAPPATQGLQANDSAYSVTVVATREVPFAENPNVQVKEVVLQVIAKGGATSPRTLIFGGPQEYVREDLRELKLADDQLIAATNCSLAVFDLKAGKKRAHVYSSCNISISPDGKRVAYVERQLHFTPPQASSSVVRVLDVGSLKTYTVFPDGPNLGPMSNGLLTTWDDDLTQIHSAGQMYWSPDGGKLLFFCIHGDFGSRDLSQERQPYLVVVYLNDLAHSRYVHEPIAKGVYLTAGAEPKDRRYLFQVERIEWLAGGAAVRVLPKPDAPWMKRDIVLKLPAPG
jgi:hypothetical protein